MESLQTSEPAGVEGPVADDSLLGPGVFWLQDQRVLALREAAMLQQSASIRMNLGGTAEILRPEQGRSFVY